MSLPDGFALPSQVDVVQAQLARVPDQQTLVGTFVSQSGAIALVDIADKRLQVRTAAAPLIPGESVRVERRNNTLTLLGPAVPRATSGRVTATGALTTVEYPNGSGVTAQMQRNSAYTPAVNDLVLIDWSTGGGVIVGKIVANPATNAPNAPGAGAAQQYDVTFLALDSGGYQGTWRTNDVWSSANTQGGWFYGSKIRDTIPDTANILVAEVFHPLQRQLGAAPFGRHGFESRPGGPLTIADASTLGGRSGWVPIPLGLINHLKANPGGLGYDYGGYNVWTGVGSDGASGALHVIYQA